MVISTNIHGVSAKKFLQLLSVLVNTVEWKDKNDSKLPYYMSGDIKIEDYSITLYTENYLTRYNVTDTIVKDEEDEQINPL